MKIISWNVNGLRAVHRKEKFFPLFHTEPDILCLQEVKVEAEQLPDEVRNVRGYHSFFTHSKGRKGYSGVAVYSKTEPDKVEYGMGIPRFDDEGRMIVLYLKDTVLLNVYFPNGGGGPERLKYKYDFYDAFLDFIEKLRKHGKHIIFCGDVNTAHEAIDLARPKENEKNTGFLPEERAWIDEVIYHGYVDTFRALHPHTRDAYTYWDMKSGARARNVGWRIDYFFVSLELEKKVKKSEMMFSYEGSDHCPLVLDIAFN